MDQAVNTMPFNIVGKEMNHQSVSYRKSEKNCFNEWDAEIQRERKESQRWTVIQNKTNFQRK